MICRLVDTRAVRDKTTKHNKTRSIFVVVERSFDDDLDLDILLGRGRPGLLRLLDRVEDAVVLRLPVALLRVDVDVHVLKS